MLLCAVNRSQPALASRNPQFINRREVRRRIVEGADSKFNLVDAVHARKQRRTAHGAKVTAVGGVSPASSLARHRYFVRRPDRKDVANRARLLSTQEAVAEADAKGFPADLKPHFTAIAAACSLWHISLPLRTNDSVLLEALHATTRSVAGLFQADALPIRHAGDFQERGLKPPSLRGGIDISLNGIAAGFLVSTAR
jgi:hypothetical protein